MSIAMIGLDTAKSVFQVHAVDEAGTTAVRRKLRRSELIMFFEKQEACTVVMEACGAAHHWARVLIGLGHEVKLVAPEAIKPFVKKGKKTMRLTQLRYVRPHAGPISASSQSRAWSNRASWPCTRPARCWSSRRRCWRTPCVGWPPSSV